MTNTKLMNDAEKMILHIDDDADDRELLWEVMQKVAPELKVIFAENGLQALELLIENQEKKSPPCLIVLDLNMPFLDGRQTFESIRANTQLRNIPLVVLSSGENPAEKALFAREGIPYFTKPVEFSAMESLASRIAELCG
jgi:CheY-like chemotaxis protein